MLENIGDYFRIMGAALEHYALTGKYSESDRQLVVDIAATFINNEEVIANIAKNVASGNDNGLLDKVSENLNPNA